MATCPICRTVYADDAATCVKDGEPLLPDRAFAGADVDLAPGWVVGEYRIDAIIGKGGFGTVYRATHPIIGKAAAVKVLSRQFSASPLMVSRFIAEARAVNQIRHRNIVDIFAFGTLDDGRHYYVMELLEGHTLESHVNARGRLPPEEAIHILRGVARALDAAHATGLAHRDLKPENVFLVQDEEGVLRPKLLDFGIAKLLTDSTEGGGHKTKTGTPMGTPSYMSPEQCRGLQVDLRTDVYSFGVLCHKLLTGRVLFEAASVMDVLFKHTAAVPPRLSEHCPELPPGLDAPVLRMLEKEASARPASVGAALEALAQAATRAGFAIPPAPVVAVPLASVPLARMTSDRPLISTPRGALSSGSEAARELELAKTIAREAGAVRTLTPAESDVVARPARRLLAVAVGAVALAVASGAIVGTAQRRPEVLGPAGPPDVSVVTNAELDALALHAAEADAGLPTVAAEAAPADAATLGIVPSASATASASPRPQPRPKKPATNRDLENPF